METNPETNDYFIKTFCEVDFEYMFAIECMHLINFAFKKYDFSDLAIKLNLKFVEPVINIVRDKAIPDYICFKVFYEDFSEDQRLKIKNL